MSTHQELLWPGKYDAEGRLSILHIPHEHVEIGVVENVCCPLGPEDIVTLPYYEAGSSECTPNILIRADNLAAVQALLPKYAGKVRLVYIDPPFDVGQRFSAEVRLPANNVGMSVPAYLDRWSEGGYAAFVYERLLVIRELLTTDGTIYVHCDHRSNSLLRFLCDEVMGRSNFRNEIIWSYNSGSRTSSDFGRRHDTILRYSISDNYYFNPDAVREPYSPDINVPKSKAHYYHPEGKVTGDVWEIDIIPQNDNSERTGYPTQKPESLLRRIIASSTEEGDIVADLFCGSGTTPATAQKMGRRWISCDMGDLAVSVSRNRIIDLNRASDAPVPFTVCKIVAPKSNERNVDAGRVSAEVISSSDGLAGVRLTGFVPVIPRMTKKKQAAFEVMAQENPFALLNSWSVDFGYLVDSPFNCNWETHRKRRAADIPLATGPIWRYSSDEAAPIGIRAVDIFGQEYMVVVHH